MRRRIGQEPVWRRLRRLVVYLTLFLVFGVLSIFLAYGLERMFGVNGRQAYVIWVAGGVVTQTLGFWRSEQRLVALMFMIFASALSVLMYLHMTDVLAVAGLAK